MPPRLIVLWISEGGLARAASLLPWFMVRGLFGWLVLLRDRDFHQTQCHGELQLSSQR
jgi:hypothetical protein